jgi:hypothetical protein
MEEVVSKGPPKRLTPALWAILGAFLGFVFGAFGTEVGEHIDVNSDKAVVRAEVFGLTVHERKLAPGAFDAVVRSWGFGLPALFTVVGGTVFCAAIVYVNRRTALKATEHE